MPKSVDNRNRRKKFAKKAKDRFTVGYVYEIGKIFEDKKWIEYFGYKCVLDKYIYILSKLDEDQKSLFLELTKRFFWINDYKKEIANQLNKILTEFKSYDNYFIVRCIKKEDERKSKSSGRVLYEIKNPLIQSQLIKPVQILDNMSDIKKKVHDFNKSLFILVDDFVGTGETAIDCMKDLKEKAPDIDGKMVIMCVAVLKEGRERLKGMHVPIFSEYSFDKGISDFYKGSEFDRNMQLMKDIEGLLNINPNYSFGYGQSEALICLIRCPNNTFPIYWHGKNTPYSRY